MAYNEADTRYFLIDPMLREKGYVSRDTITCEKVMTRDAVEPVGFKGRRRQGSGRSDYLLCVQVEGYHLELKASVDKSMVEEACAFANSGGGTIVLGVTDRGETVGIDTGNEMRSRVQDSLRQIEPPLDIRVRVVGRLLVVDVPAGREKPYGCSKGFFMRVGANTQKMSRNEIISFFQKEGRVRFDELEATKAEFERDFDKTAFRHLPPRLFPERRECDD